MNKLLMDKDSLIIECQDSVLFSWKHRNFFSVALGFRVDEKNGRYVKKSDTPIELLTELLSYFEDDQISFEADEKITILLNQIKL